jgi:hypothetical protein
MDIADLYDHEIMKVGVIYRELMAKYSRKPNSRFNVEEFVKDAHDRFLKIGLVVEIGTTECLLGIGPPSIDIVARTPGSIEDAHGLDHERKRSEVLDSKMRGEKFRGEKEQYNG